MNMLIWLVSNFGGWIIVGLTAIGTIWGIRLQGKRDGEARVRALGTAAALEAAAARRKSDAAISAAGTDAARNWLRTNNRK
jgi:hypothetical protein